MSVKVRDAKIYIKELDKIVIGYEPKGTIMQFSVKEIKNGDGGIIRFELDSDKWLIIAPNQPRALLRNRIDIYIDLALAKELIKTFETIDSHYPGLKISDCAGLRSSFFPDGFEKGPKKLPQGFNSFRAPIIGVTLEIHELNVKLQSPGGEIFIDYEENDETHWYKFSTPALHFAVRAPSWNKQSLSISQNKWIIDVNVKCERAILEALRNISMVETS